MNTKLLALTFVVVSSLVASQASAQLSSPVAGVAGTGAGVHSPNSPFAPLPARADVLSWNVLTDVKTKTIKGSIMPVFNASQMALNQRSQRIQGFMMPLDPGEKQTHFLLTNVPTSCSFCMPAGPEGIIEVRTKTPVKYSFEPVLVEGKFAVLQDDPTGMYYRLTGATPVSP